jgi:hypothetical protein
MCLLSAGTVEAQAPRNTSSPSEYAVYLTGGMSNLKYSLAQDGDVKGGVGFGGGLAYIRNLSSSFGISLGLEVSSFRGSALYKSLQETYEAIDDRGTRIEYSYSIDNYR